MTAKILLVDDEPDIVWLLNHTLTEDGYEVQSAPNGVEGLRLAYAFQPDLVLLDIMMPAMDGWEVLRRLREFSDVPVIMLTVVSGEDNLVEALEIGADDYVTKPFTLEELKARVRAVLRRTALSPSEGGQRLTFDDGRLVIDPASQRVTVRGRVADLAPTEYKLLLFLAYNAGQVLTHQQILDNVWGLGYEDSLPSVKVYIQRLRRKIEVDPRQPAYIKTKRGTGYFMTKN
jgi:two-component system KDP operon response regulator KdpE